MYSLFVCVCVCARARKSPGMPGILLLDRFDDDGDFEEYQQSLMLTMFPPPTADGSLHETMITRHTNVLGYLVLEDAHVLCGNMKTMMMDLSRDRFSRPPGSSSRGAQADPDATKTDNDDDSGAPATQRGRYV
uniref:Uncharacterized protein n=1 Tax=Fagus sylvatica TaxID=28930 RepID=A0A2N9HPA5_FAGSY